MKEKKRLYLVGLGMGNDDLLTIRAKNALENAEIIFGAKRILEISKKILVKPHSGDKKQTTVRYEEFYTPGEILNFLQKNPEFSSVAVVFSGDTGFFSGAAAFFKDFDTISSDWEIEAVNGIASPVYFASKLHKSFQNWKLLSLHGSKCNAIEQIRRHKDCFFILSGAEDVKNLGKKIKTAQQNGILSDIKCHLGSNLSYDVEKIIQVTPDEMEQYQVLSESLFVLLVENENAVLSSVLPNLKDEDFIRGEKIPMTKKEIRVFSVCALAPSKSSVVYDIGSGTGSVTTELARAAYEGQVFAFDSKPEAVNLTKKNLGKFALENAVCMCGNAPECLKKAGLPPPDCAFIGGSGGNLSEIIEILFKKNPKVKIVANFVSLEGISEINLFLKSKDDDWILNHTVEITQISVSKCEKAGNFHLMKAQNPVFVVKFWENEQGA